MFRAVGTPRVISSPALPDCWAIHPQTLAFTPGFCLPHPQMMIINVITIIAMLIWKEWWVGWCPCQFPSIHCPTGNLIAATEASLIFIIIIIIYNSLCVCWFSNLAPRFLLNLTPNIWKLHILGKLGCTANPTSTGCISEKKKICSICILHILPWGLIALLKKIGLTHIELFLDPRANMC